MLRSLVYTSSANTIIDHNCLKNILDECIAWNLPHQISGLLIYHEGTFLQVIEGESEDVNEIFNKIRRDPRHKDVTLLMDEEIHEREFGKWGMAFREVQYEDLSQASNYIKLKELEFGEAVKQGGAKSILKAFYEMNIDSGIQHNFKLL